VKTGKLSGKKKCAVLVPVSVIERKKISTNNNIDLTMR